MDKVLPSGTKRTLWATSVSCGEGRDCPRGLPVSLVSSTVVLADTSPSCQSICLSNIDRAHVRKPPKRMTITELPYSRTRSQPPLPPLASVHPQPV